MLRLAALCSCLFGLAIVLNGGDAVAQTSSPTWLKCDWTATRNTLIAGKLGPDEVSEQSRTYQFDPTTDELSVYDPETRTLNGVSGVFVTDEVVDAQTTRNLTAANGAHSEIFHDTRIDRRTLKFFQLDTVQPLLYSPSTSTSTIGTGQCVKIAPQPLIPAQF
jgi:hypothetical protein